MLLRATLAELANQLRHAHTRLLPIEIGERVQHSIVRIESLLAMPLLDLGAAEAASQQAKELLAECESFATRR